MGDLFDLACREVYPATKQSLSASRPHRDMKQNIQDEWVPALLSELEMIICCIGVENTQCFMYW